MVQGNPIEIVQWVKFNQEGLREEIKQLAKECPTKMEFLREVKAKYNLTLQDANVVVNKFYKE